MSIIAETLADFGKSIGLENLTFRDNGTVLLDMEKLGSLAIEWIGDRQETVSLSLIRRIEVPDERACKRLLESCHYRSPAPFPTRLGLAGAGELFFAVRLEAREFTLPGIHQALEWLIAVHDQNSSSVRYA
ncbi:CesT family type III secretion system chaperone [Prosthecobacter dejongeii]|uniref:Type III secretion system chaperone SycN n=1 Tax=Prosthecobacter dejongeii TaxID=48465 RepID=A0A7W8DQ05_9BACT|nr:CesT family type III secretion system chaperone [Prosthecobacter dejongeii]MBB5037715.1 type III secretion system chaperone SycN [Prosthecobacter dejongeii]